MNELDQRILEPTPETALPPLVRYWKDRLAAGDKLRIEIHRPETAGLARTKMVVLRSENGTEQPPQQFDWDDELNAGLIDLGVRAKDVEQEGIRFALGIRAALRKVERRYGDGYLNAVLVELMKDSDFSRNGRIAEVMQHVTTNPPDQTRSCMECRELIADEIGGRSLELKDKLNYGPEERKAIMQVALATYLDERFSVSSRHRFGLL